MKNFKLAAIALALASISLLWSCNDPSVIGLSVQPVNDRINVRNTDTISLTSYTVSTDSVRSDNSTQNLLGSYMDPVFGKTNASFYAVADLLSFNNSFGTSPVADSMVLSLAYTGFYGDTTTQQTVTVYQLTQAIANDSVYYSNKKFTYDSLNPLAIWPFYPKVGDSVSVGGAMQIPQLRIPLSNTLANSILNTSAANLATDAAFTTFFNGIYVKATDVNTSGKGAILYFNALNYYSGITIYFHNSTSTGQVFQMVFDNLSARVNHFEHNFYTAPFNSQLSNNTIVLPEVYSQCMSGVRTFIDFPNIKHLLDSGKIAINKAELVVTVSDNSNPLYSLPANMILYGLDALGNEISLPDYSLSTYQVPLTNNNEYDFILNDYIQQVLSGKMTNHGLHLECALGAATANRVILGGPKNTGAPMKLKITYTKL